MSKEVKRYRLFASLRREAIAFLPDEVVSARDYDALLAERDALAKDAARWRHARSILAVDAIETAQSEYINFGLPPAESESIRADQAIDAALQGEQP